MKIFPLLFAAILIIAIPLWQAKRRKDLVRTIDDVAPALKASFAGRVWWNGFWGRYRSGNNQVDNAYRKYRTEIIFLRVGGLTIFFLMMAALALIGGEN